MLFMKRLFNQARKKVRDRQDYEENEYDWDRLEESEDSGEAVYEEVEEDGEGYGQQEAVRYIEDVEGYGQREAAGYIEDGQYYKAEDSEREEDVELSEEEIEESYWCYKAEEEDEAVHHDGESVEEIEEESKTAEYYVESAEEIEEEGLPEKYSEEAVSYAEPGAGIGEEEDSWYEEAGGPVQYDEEPFEEIEEGGGPVQYYEEPFEEIEEESGAAGYDEEPAEEIEEEGLLEEYSEEAVSYAEPGAGIGEEEDSWYEEAGGPDQYDEEPFEEIEEGGGPVQYYEEPVEEIEEESGAAGYDEEPAEEIEEEGLPEEYSEEAVSYAEPGAGIGEEEDSWYEEAGGPVQYYEGPFEEIEEGGGPVQYDEEPFEEIDEGRGTAEYDEEPAEEIEEDDLLGEYSEEAVSSAEPGAGIEEEDYSWYYESERQPKQNGQPYDSGVPLQEGVAAYEEDAECIVASARNRVRHRNGRQSTVKRGKKVRRMDVMDKVMLVTGAAILILAVMIIGMFANARIVQKQVLDFANVGLQLEGIQIIGERGLMAVANARIAKIAEAVPAPTEEPQEDNKDYNEVAYNRQMSVEPSFTSIQKDLKIKFINRNSDKLVPNVPFSVTVIGPDGKNYIWSDDDMDGIIYKKDIEPGTYQVAMETLTDSRYSDYAISTSTQSVEVKKEISYNKVDVANEVKQETEVNVAKEDTKKNETVVESVLEDTVSWVESKVYAVTYHEVEKSTIPDPATLSARRKLTGKNQVELLAQVQTEAPTTEPAQAQTEVPTAEPTQVPTEAPTAEPTQVPTEAPTAEPTQVPTEAPTAEPTQVPTEAPTAEPTQVPTVPPTAEPTPVPSSVKGTLTVEHSRLTGGRVATLTTKASASGFAEGRTVVYSVQTNNPAVATASVDAEGNIRVFTVAEGNAVITVKANYEGGTEETEAAATIEVTVSGGMALTLEPSSLKTYVRASAAIHAVLTGVTVQDPSVTAESSDTNIATVSVDGTDITVTGVAEGSAVVTVKYAENGAEVSARCDVAVTKNDAQESKTPLKDAEGRQLYVMAGSSYREAVYADYYTAEKFYVKGDAKYTGWQTIGGKIYYFTEDGNKVNGEQVIQGAKYHFAEDGSLITGEGILGIDVSKWNGNIDWNAVKNSGVSYVIIRCGYRGSSEGKLIEDPKYEANIQGASAAGLKVGVYFFSQAVDEVEAVEEASMVLEQIKNYKLSYPVFIDVEASGGRGDKLDKAARTAVCKAFCTTIQNAGYTAGVYSNKLWMEGKIDMGSLNSYKVWLAQYAAAPTYAGKYDIWQYKAKGSVSGISGNVDMNISYLGN